MAPCADAPAPARSSSSAPAPMGLLLTAALQAARARRRHRASRGMPSRRTMPRGSARRRTVLARGDYLAALAEAAETRLLTPIIGRPTGRRRVRCNVRVCRRQSAPWRTRCAAPAQGGIDRAHREREHTARARLDAAVAQGTHGCAARSRYGVHGHGGLRTMPSQAADRHRQRPRRLSARWSRTVLRSPTTGTRWRRRARRDRSGA